MTAILPAPVVPVTRTHEPLLACPNNCGTRLPNLPRKPCPACIKDIKKERDYDRAMEDLP